MAYRNVGSAVSKATPGAGDQSISVHVPGAIGGLTEARDQAVRRLEGRRRSPTLDQPARPAGGVDQHASVQRRSVAQVQAAPPREVLRPRRGRRDHPPAGLLEAAREVPVQPWVVEQRVRPRELMRPVPDDPYGRPARRHQRVETAEIEVSQLVDPASVRLRPRGLRVRCHQNGVQPHLGTRRRRGQPGRTSADDHHIAVERGHPPRSSPPCSRRAMRRNSSTTSGEWCSGSRPR